MQQVTQPRTLALPNAARSLRADDAAMLSRPEPQSASAPGLQRSHVKATANGAALAVIAQLSTALAHDRRVLRAGPLPTPHSKHSPPRGQMRFNR